MEEEIIEFKYRQPQKEYKPGDRVMINSPSSPDKNGSLATVIKYKETKASTGNYKWTIVQIDNDSSTSCYKSTSLTKLI